MKLVECEYICYFDGSCPVNPGGEMGMGIIIYNFCTDTGIYENSWYRCPDENNSNNAAEYLAVLGILNYFNDHDNTKIKIYGDSKLVVKQLSGEMKIKSGAYKPHAIEAKKLLLAIQKRGNQVEFEWIPRKENKTADALSKRYQWDDRIKEEDRNKLQEFSYNIEKIMQ